MFKRELVKLTFKVTPAEGRIIERAMSAVRGNFGLEPTLEEERGRALIMMARMILSEYNPSENSETQKSPEASEKKEDTGN